MFALSFIALLAGSALATPFKRFDGLTVKVSGPASSVNSIDDLSFTASVTNTGAEDVKILKYGTVLDSLPTRSFTVTKDGADVDFTGIQVNVELNDGAYTTIASGETVSVTHQVASLYDFANSGLGTYSFTPITTFQVAGAEEKEVVASKLSKVQVSTNQIDVEITGDVAKRAHSVNKRATDICTTSSKKTFIDASYTESKSLASIASSYVTSKGASDSLYKSYFGATATSKVTTILNAVANESSSSRTLSCVDTYSVCDGNVIAYTVTSTTNIYFCSIFFNEVATTSLCSGTTVASRNIRGGTTLHEMTHATSGTSDVTYGCAADIALSDANSVKNADNFNCFVTQVYANTKC